VCVCLCVCVCVCVYPVLPGSSRPWEQSVLPAPGLHSKQATTMGAHIRLPLAVNSKSEKRHLTATDGARSCDLRHASAPLWPLDLVPPHSFQSSFILNVFYPPTLFTDFYCLLFCISLVCPLAQFSTLNKNITFLVSCDYFRVDTDDRWRVRINGATERKGLKRVILSPQLTLGH
jgi:hypothetical protein